MEVLGIDIGGTGIKAAVVDTLKGELLTERIRYGTPDNAKPECVLDVIARVRDDLNWKGSAGCGFPGVVRGGVTHTAANLGKAWVGFGLEEALQKVFRAPAYCVNDADAAGLAEVKHGVAQDYAGVVLMITVGTGLGTALFTDGRLVPNAEMGHLLINPKQGKTQTMEQYASNRARKANDLKWPEWAERFNEVLQAYAFYTQPECIVVGGGIVKKWDRFSEIIDCPVRVERARMGNFAGMIGAADYAVSRQR